MKIHYVISALFFINFSYAQTDDNSLINNAISQFFEGLNSGDTSLISKVINVEAFNLQSFIVIDGKGELQVELPDEFLETVAKPKKYDFEERILEQTIHCDGFIASAWLPYECYINGKLSHTGVDVIQLAKIDDRWQLISVFDSRIVPKK